MEIAANITVIIELAGKSWSAVMSQFPRTVPTIFIHCIYICIPAGERERVFLHPMMQKIESKFDCFPNRSLAKRQRWKIQTPGTAALPPYFFKLKKKKLLQKKNKKLEALLQVIDYHITIQFGVQLLCLSEVGSEE